jgi:Dyp-type peroxidase family
VAAHTPKLDLDDIQGLVARGYKGLKHARFTIFAASDQAAAQALLSWLLPRVATAGRFAADSALHVAFTPAGLRRLGLAAERVAGFSAEFVAGMTAPEKSRFLGDVEDSDPGSWDWGSPQGGAIDGVVLLYAASRDVLDARQAELNQRLAEVGARQIATLDTRELSDYEPFGFHDGISQPAIEGLPKAKAFSQDGRAVPPGEFVLGYPNAYGELTDRPLLPASEDPRRLLLPDPAGTGAVDLGRNGTYLVIRQLEQDVDAFWRYVGQASGEPDGARSPRARALAAKMVGRWPSGAPLVKSPDRDDRQLSRDNDFGYHTTDAFGLACPLGAHIRRMNPRDSLDPDPGSDASVRVSDMHRILRRARSYGADEGSDTPAAAVKDQSAKRLARGDTATPSGTGLHFVCLVGSLARQFEFVQHTWLNGATFNGLYDDTDPLAGSRHPSGATFTAPAHPVRRRYRDLPQFVRTRGGAYFFLPGISALRYLAQLPGTVPSPSATR